nr:sulfatase [Halogeometricum sp. CBA1124]
MEDTLRSSRCGRNDASDGGAAMSRPNVVLTVLDTARARDTVPASSSPMPTLADVAADGTEFTNAFSPAPWTLPSHASLFTGTYPSQHGAHGDHTYLDDSPRTLAEAFSAAGYETVGVSNNTWVTEEFGFGRGFDTLRKGWQYVQSDTDLGTVTRAEHPMEKLRAAGDRLFDGNPLVNAANLVYDEFAAGDGAERATSWVDSWLSDRDDETPFFCFLNFIEPHAEYRPPREYAEPYLPPDTTYDEATTLRQDPRAYDVGEYALNDREFEALRGLYRGSLAYLDDQLARLRESLVAAGEWEDTVFVALGDHGENIGDHGFFGHQYNLYDTLLHVPMVARGGPFDGGRRDDLVQTLDLAPTLLDAAGIDDPAFERQMHARSLHPDATRATPSSRSTSARNRRPTRWRRDSARYPTASGRSTGRSARSGRPTRSTSPPPTAASGSTASARTPTRRGTARTTTPSGRVCSRTASTSGSTPSNTPRRGARCR